MKRLFRRLVPLRLRHALARQALRLDRRIFTEIIYHEYAGWSWSDCSLANLKQLGFEPKVIYDIGAFEGEFYTTAHRLWPAAFVHLFEAQKEKEPIIQSVLAGNPRTALHLGVLGPEDGREVNFHFQESGSSVLPDLRGEGEPAKREAMRTQRLDTILGPPRERRDALLKIDVQGYELEVLKGGEALLQNVEAIFIECSLLELNEGNPLLAEVIEYLGRFGFRIYDICSFMKRGGHRRLRQIDAIFLHQDSPLQAKK